MTQEREAIAERWLPVVGWEDAYEVSDLGSVRSIDRTAPHNMVATQAIKGGPLTPKLNKRGYLVVGLRRGKDFRQNCMVHRLVALAFLPPVEGKPNVNHIDNDRANPTLANLEWSTQAENLAHMDRQGRRRSRPRSGAENHNAVLTVEQVRNARADFTAGIVSRRGLRARLGVGRCVVNRMIAGRTYTNV